MSYLLKDHRSSTGSRSGLHTSLQVEAFGYFIDKMSSCDPEIDPKYLRVAASVMKAMSMFYRTEQEQVNAFLESSFQTQSRCPLDKPSLMQQCKQA